VERVWISEEIKKESIYFPRITRNYKTYRAGIQQSNVYSFFDVKGFLIISTDIDDDDG
jgi:hypothetical protein